MLKKPTYRSLSHITLLKVLMLFVICAPLEAQRISFSTWTGSDDISIMSPQGAFPALDFNLKQTIMLPNSDAVNIDLNDTQAIIFEIEAPDGFDLTVELDAPSQLVLLDNPSETIPFQLRLAYNNQNPMDELSGKLNAVELPLGFNSVNFPISRRNSGMPAAPPSPEFGGQVRSKSRAYIYLYGGLGPIGNIPAGRYEGEVNINVSFIDHD